MSRFLAALGGEGHLAPPQEERAERVRIEATLHELERVRPWGSVTEEALAALKERFRRRLAYLNTAPGERHRLAAEAAPAAAEPASGATGAPGPAPLPAASMGATAVASPPVRTLPATPGPGLREFLAERSILIVSYVGAFLLIVATLLFELAAETFGGPVRFAGVLALDLVFGAAAWVCWRSPRLRIVGTTYLAIFALIAPLVFVAAYVFLVLREQGVSVSLAVAVGALSCAALYGALASRLRSAGYAALSALAVLAAWCGALVTAGLGEWGGAGLPPLVALFGLVAFGALEGKGVRAVGAVRRTPREWLALPERLAEGFIHATAAFALLWTMLGTMEGLLGGSPNAADRWAMTATLGGLVAAYGLYGWLARRWWVAALAAALTSLAVLAACSALDAAWWVTSAILLALGWLYAAAAVWLPAGVGVRVRGALRGLAALQVVVCALVPEAPDALQAAIVLAAAALGVFLAWTGSTRPSLGEGAASRWWLLLACALGSLDWFWLVRLAVPPPRPSFLGLLTAYAPLPVLLAAAGLAVSRWRGRAWALPVYVVAAGNALWVGLGLAFERESAVPGWVYLAFAVTAYAVTWLERTPGGAASATVLLASGVAGLLRGADQPAAWWPPVLAALPWAVYGIGLVRDRSWWEEHRWAALALASLVAVGCFGEESFYGPGEPGALAALGALLGCSALPAVDGTRRGGREGAYERAGALVLAATGGFWVARYLDLENPQWYVALPGLALLADGQILRRRDPVTGRALSGLGLALLLGTTALQLFGGEPDDAVYTAVLVAEAVVAVLVGVGLRQRVYVLAGAAGVAVAALRALLMLLSQVPLFVVFGLAALLLLGLAALLAFLRERLGRAGGTAAAGWADWD